MAEEKQTTAAVKYENVADYVLSLVDSYKNDGGLRLPENYSVENALKSAYLVLQSTKTKEGKPVLEVCTKSSISNSLLDMVVQGLSVSKKQCYFIPYGTELTLSRSYFGTVALAKVAGGLTKDPIANIIYEGDEFVYEIDPLTGLKKIIKHSQSIVNINNDKIIGAYAIIEKADGSHDVEIMNISQIRASWNQGQMKGQSGAHKNFTDQMAKKTVTNRACKMVINSSNDAYLYEGKKDESEADEPMEQRTREIEEKANKKVLAMSVDTPYEEIKESEKPIENRQDPQPQAAPY